MSTVTIPVSRNVKSRSGLRPILSPKWPSRMPPSGRATKPTAKLERESSAETAVFSLGKKSSPNTRAERVPKTKKSYYSSTDPMVLAATAARAVLGAAVGRDLVVLLIVSSLKIIQRKERYGIDSGIDPIRYITRGHACTSVCDGDCARPVRGFLR